MRVEEADEHIWPALGSCGLFSHFSGIFRMSGDVCGGAVEMKSLVLMDQWDLERRKKIKNDRKTQFLTILINYLIVYA